LEKFGLFLLGVAFAGGGNGFFFDYQNAPAVFGTPFLKRVVVPVEMRVLRILVLCL
jgi:hypothetical protein